MHTSRTKTELDIHGEGKPVSLDYNLRPRKIKYKMHNVHIIIFYGIKLPLYSNIYLFYHLCDCQWAHISIHILFKPLQPQIYQERALTFTAMLIIHLKVQTLWNNSHEQNLHQSPYFGIPNMPMQVFLPYLLPTTLYCCIYLLKLNERILSVVK